MVKSAIINCGGTSPETLHDHDLRSSPDGTGVTGSDGIRRCKTYVEELPKMEGLKNDPDIGVLRIENWSWSHPS
jgi:hypothetical protein